MFGSINDEAYLWMFCSLMCWPQPGGGADQPEEDCGEAAWRGARVVASRARAEVPKVVEDVQVLMFFMLFMLFKMFKMFKMFKFLCFSCCSRCSSFYVVLVVQDVQVVEFDDCVFICILYSRYALKKELDSKNNSESMYQLGNLALSIQVCAKGKIQKSRSNIFSESTHSQLQQLNCLAQQQASVLVQLRQQRRSTKCPKFLPPSDRFCQKSSNFDCVDSVSSSARALKDAFHDRAFGTRAPFFIARLNQSKA